MLADRDLPPSSTTDSNEVAQVEKPLTEREWRKTMLHGWARVQEGLASFVHFQWIRQHLSFPVQVGEDLGNPGWGFLGRLPIAPHFSRLMQNLRRERAVKKKSSGGIISLW